MNRVPEGLLSAQLSRGGPLFGMRTDARGCMKTLNSQQYRELFSVFCITHFPIPAHNSIPV